MNNYFCKIKPIMLAALLLTFTAPCPSNLIIAAEGSAKDNKPESKNENSVRVEYGWCNVTFPKSVKPNEEFEIVFDMIDLKEITRSWEANKLAIHLFGDSSEKWGGYICPFKAIAITKDGIVKITGKFNLNDKQKQELEFIRISAILCSEWENQEKTKVAGFMGPRILIIK